MPIPLRPVYNVVPDQRDQRDYLAPRAPRLRTLPPRVDIHETGAVPPIWDQGSLGSCTGHGIGRAHEIERRLNQYAPRMPSRLFIYYTEREEEGTLQEDAGAQIRTGIKLAARLGVPREELHPYDIGRWRERPSPAAYADALEHQVTEYARLAPTVEAICGALAEGRPVVLGFEVFGSFQAPEVTRTGVMPMPDRREQRLGGHCVCATGYVRTDVAPRSLWRTLVDTVTGRPQHDGYLLCDNSWGADWGQGGRFRMPFAFVRAGYVFDPWVIDAVEA